MGVSGNERADELAKFAAYTLEAKDRPLPNRDLNPIIKAAAFHSWQFSWDLEECNKMKETTTRECPWNYYPMDRRRETALCRLRIGHTRLTHGFLMSQDPPPFCEDCLVPLTVRHLLVECPSLGETRFRFFSDCRDRQGNYLLREILGESFNEMNLFGFIEEVGFLAKI